MKTRPHDGAREREREKKKEQINKDDQTKIRSLSLGPRCRSAISACVRLLPWIRTLSAPPAMAPGRQIPNRAVDTEQRMADPGGGEAPRIRDPIVVP